mgnify:CR=1 FL=1
MKCPSCAKNTENTRKCDKCNIDIRAYKQVHMMAARLYNKGLEQAQGRSLSGAIESLTMCIRLQKNHIDANNLLGLVYFEVGEIGSAINYWLKSLSYKEENNIAKDYLEKVQSSPSQLTEYSNTMTLFNKSLEYMAQGSEDIAVISLRKAISQNPNYIKAKELLTLYYISNNQEAQAAQLLKEIFEISKDQAKANYYWDMIDPRFKTEEMEVAKVKPVKINRPKPISAKEPTTTIEPGKIIEPRPFKGNIIAFIIGAVCMLGVYAMLITPSKTSELKQEIKQAQDKNSELQNQLEELEIEQKEMIANLEAEKGELEKTNLSLKKDQEIQEAKINLQGAQDLFAKREWVEAADKLNNINKDFITDETREEYEELVGAVYPRAGEELYNQGYRKYQSKEYVEAIELFEKSYSYAKEERYTDNVLYMIGRSYEAQENMEQAKQYYNSVIENYPDTDGAYNAKRRLK